MTLNSDAISLTNVTKIFHTGVIKRKTAVEDLTFSVARGEVVGLLGANGSGKSTTIKMILGFLKATHGELTVCGHNTEERIARSFIGYLPENPRFQRFLTAHDVMKYFGRLLGMRGEELEKRIAHLLELVSLKHVTKERVHGFSKGMTQRLALAQALLNRPPLLIFDEPMSGLDPLGRKEIRSLIMRIHDEMPDSTMFFSTHILGDVEQVCSSVILLKQGRLKRQCTLDELLSQGDQRFELLIRNLAPSLHKKYLDAFESRLSAGGIQVVVDGAEALAAKLAEVEKDGATVASVNSQRKSLEDELFADTSFPLPVATNQSMGKSL